MVDISTKDAHRAMYIRTSNGFELREKPLCMVCVADGKSGRDARATSYELHSCNQPAHVRHMRAVNRWAKRTVGLVISKFHL